VQARTRELRRPHNQALGRLPAANDPAERVRSRSVPFLLIDNTYPMPLAQRVIACGATFVHSPGDTGTLGVLEARGEHDQHIVYSRLTASLGPRWQQCPAKARPSICPPACA